MNPQRSAILVDGSNAYATCKQLGFDIDYKRLKDFIDAEVEVHRALYFTALPEDSNQITPLKPLVDFLSYNGWNVVTKPTKTFMNDVGELKVKGNMDMEIAIEALKLASHVSDMYILSGDGDFKALVIALQDVGVRVTVISSITTRPSMCADLLRRQADDFIELSEIKISVERRRG
jgi:uncharacterized LabA/DUF88 family protein